MCLRVGVSNSKKIRLQFSSSLNLQSFQSHIKRVIYVFFLETPLNLSDNNCKMSERLKRLLDEALIRKGVSALSREAGLTEGTVRNAARGKGIPRRRNAYLLALACGATEQDALGMAHECVQPKKRA